MLFYLELKIMAFLGAFLSFAIPDPLRYHRYRQTLSRTGEDVGKVFV
jgi:hypothetical protein